MQHNYIADQLHALSALLKTYNSKELELVSMTLTNIASEVRKHRVGAWTGELDPQGKKPEPPRIDPNSKIPRPTTPPKGSGPVKLALAPGLEVQI